MSEASRIQSQIELDERSASEQFLPQVYDELRRLAAHQLAQEKPGQTLQPTALVHEAYLRLVNSSNPPRWDSERHFFAAAAEAMRRILINRARDRKRLKRGGDRRRIDLDRIEVAVETPAEELLELDDAIRRLAAEDQLCANLVKLRFFAGLGQRETAQVLGLAPRTADRHWAYARAWLYDQLSQESD